MKKCAHNWFSYHYSYEGKFLWVFPITKKVDMAVCRGCHQILVPAGLTTELRKEVLDHACMILDTYEGFY